MKTTNLLTSFQEEVIHQLELQEGVTYDDIAKLTHGRTLYHKRLKDSRGNAVQIRISGKVKTWKRRPGEFDVPAKHGLYTNLRINQRNAPEWSLHEPPIQHMLKFRPMKSKET
jgi:hypothetical protein